MAMYLRLQCLYSSEFYFGKGVDLILATPRPSFGLVAPLPLNLLVGEGFVRFLVILDWVRVKSTMVILCC